MNFFLVKDFGAKEVLQLFPENETSTSFLIDKVCLSAHARFSAMSILNFRMASMMLLPPTRIRVCLIRYFNFHIKQKATWFNHSCKTNFEFYSFCFFDFILELTHQFSKQLFTIYFLYYDQYFVIDRACGRNLTW